MSFTEHASSTENQPQESAAFGETFLPPYRINNDELARYLSRLGIKSGTGQEITGERITSTTGIENHYYLQPLGQTPESQQITVPELAVNLAERTILQKEWHPSSIRHIVFCSSYPVGRNISRQIARDINALNCQTLDVYVACSGFTYALKEIKKRARSGERVLMVAAEHYSAKMKDDLNRSIFSDGAASFAFENNRDFRIVDNRYIYERSDAIKMPINDTLVPFGLLPGESMSVNIPKSEEFFEMEGSRVLEWAAKRTPFHQTVNAFLAAKELSSAITIIPHQGSGRLVRLYAQNLLAAGVDAPISSETVSKIGNLASASIPAEINAHLSHNNTKRGDILILAGFGAGLITSIVTLQALRDLPKAA